MNRRFGRKSPLVDALRVGTLSHESPGQAVGGWVSTRYAIIRYPAAATRLYYYDADNTGFADALTECMAGDALILPPTSISGDHTMIAGVAVVGLSREETVLTGTITGVTGASLESLSLEYTANDSAWHNAIWNPASGTFSLRDCNVYATQSGSGNIACVRITTNTGDVYADNCDFRGVSTGGQGFAVHKYDPAQDGQLIAYNGSIYASYLATNF